MGSVTDLASALPGDERAAFQIWERYARQLLVIARRNLDERLRRRVDDEDVVQSVFKSFFEGAADGAFRLSNRDELWNMLLTIVLRKVRNSAVHHSRRRRDFHREKAAKASGSELAYADQIARGPTPAEAAEFNDELERLLRLLPSQEFAEIVTLRFTGLTIPEVAAKLDYDQRTVERKLAIIRSLWKRESQHTEV